MLVVSAGQRTVQLIARAVKYGSGGCASPNHLCAYPPRQDDQRIGVITAQEQRIKFAEPFLQRRDAFAIGAGVGVGEQAMCD